MGQIFKYWELYIPKIIFYGYSIVGIRFLEDFREISISGQFFHDPIISHCLWMWQHMSFCTKTIFAGRQQWIQKEVQMEELIKGCNLYKSPQLSHSGWLSLFYLQTITHPTLPLFIVSSSMSFPPCLFPNLATQIRRQAARGRAFPPPPSNVQANLHKISYKPDVFFWQGKQNFYYRRKCGRCNISQALQGR